MSKKVFIVPATSKEYAHLSNRKLLNLIERPGITQRVFDLPNQLDQGDHDRSIPVTKRVFGLNIPLNSNR